MFEISLTMSSDWVSIAQSAAKIGFAIPTLVLIAALELVQTVLSVFSFAVQAPWTIAFCVLAVAIV